MGADIDAGLVKENEPWKASCVQRDENTLTFGCGLKKAVNAFLWILLMFMFQVHCWHLHVFIDVTWWLLNAFLWILLVFCSCSLLIFTCFYWCFLMVAASCPIVMHYMAGSFPVQKAGPCLKKYDTTTKFSPNIHKTSILCCVSCNLASLLGYFWKDLLCCCHGYHQGSFDPVGLPHSFFGERGGGQLALLQCCVWGGWASKGFFGKSFFPAFERYQRMQGSLGQDCGFASCENWW